MESLQRIWDDKAEQQAEQQGFFMKIPPYLKDSVRDKTKQRRTFLQILTKMGMGIVMENALNERGCGNVKALVGCCLALCGAGFLIVAGRIMKNG